MRTVKRVLAPFESRCEVRFDEPLAAFTTFRVGGPADALIFPRSSAQLAAIVSAARTERMPLFIIGGGANIVVADAGIRGIVVATRDLSAVQIQQDSTALYAGAGAPISDVAAWAADRSLGGLEFIYAMPGSTGGAVWMNARCYDGEISAVLREVEFVTMEGAIGTYQARAQDFAYKHSPFQDGMRIITGARFALHRADRELLWRQMRSHEGDRQAKGHFAAPCAGSVFKNDRSFGAPSGAIIDRLGLRGIAIGGAMVSTQHANIIVNNGNATAAEIRALTELVAARVLAAHGFRLEPEILFVGDWDR